MAKKTLNTAAIANELQNSAFFPASLASPARPAPPTLNAPAPDASLTLPVPPVPTSPAPQSSQASATSKSSNPNQPPRDPAVMPNDADDVDGAVASDASNELIELGRSSGPVIPPTPPKAQMPASSFASPDASMLAEMHERHHTTETTNQSHVVRDEIEARTDQTEWADSAGSTGNRSMIEAIRKSVRHIGKEVSFVRLTPEEKRQLIDIAYTYKSQGIKTSENEISRIGINWMLEDYEANGANSVLAKVLAALNA